MYHTISPERSLFFIDTHFVNTFQTLAGDLFDDTLQVEPNLFNVEDSWTSVFNIWLLLQADEHLIVESFDKSFYYSINQLIIKALKKDYHINLLRTHHNSSQELFFISAIYLSNGISAWLKQLLLEHRLEDIADYFYEIQYYEAYNAGIGDVKQFLGNQARFVKILAPELKAAGTFNRMLKKQIDQAHFYYSDYYLLKKA